MSLSKMRWKLFLLGFFKVPLIYYVRPKLVRCNDIEMLKRIPFRRRTKKHLNSMCYGALNKGAVVLEKMEEALHTNSRVDFNSPVEVKIRLGEVVALFEMDVSIRIN
ncbi:MAG: hypothetical protein ACKO00_00750 [Crocinitomicaceae bacterium]